MAVSSCVGGSLLEW
ncbi:hypothetical protein SY1_01550 [Fretibacterium fastidiosum]|uniref:Uncharacterized protein n=1 Tax=Fretibacterium fastidiosum TaxID=651822 RepID=A0AB94IVC3_9BACT|nr:hypothetical protein SY1_01550 [Fretibacterium fastidiosum]